MAKSIDRIEEALTKLESLGAKLSILFSVAFVFVVLSVVFCLVVEALHFSDSGQALEPMRLMQLISTLLDFAIYGAILLAMRGIAKDVALCRSPFTIMHANQIRIIAWLFLAGFFLGIATSPGFVSIADVGDLHVGFASDQAIEYPVFHLDVKSVVGAVVCFSLSSVWKYGALLQADSDDYL